MSPADGAGDMGAVIRRVLTHAGTPTEFHVFPESVGPLTNLLTAALLPHIAALTEQAKREAREESAAAIERRASDGSEFRTNSARRAAHLAATIARDGNDA